MRYLRTKSSVGLAVLLILLASVALLRADPGDLDLTFGGGAGYVTTSIGDFDLGISMVIDSSDRIIVVGVSGNEESYNYWGSIVRYNPDGTIDTTFGTNGIVLMDSNHFGQLSSVTLDASERILVAGVTEHQGLLARFNSDGTLDPTFGNQGMIIDQDWSQFSALGIKADGKIIVAGTRTSGFALSRYNADGTLDLTFGNLGISSAVPFSSVGISLVMNQDNSLVVVGYSDSGGNSSDLVLAKFTSDGAFDPNFGAGGIVTTDVNQFDDASRIFADSDGKILIVGTSGSGASYSTTSQILIARYLPDGTLDATFGNNGIVLTESEVSGAHYGYSLVIDASNRIVVAGERPIPESETSSIFLARYHSDGSLDTSFSDDGYLIGNFSSYDVATDVKLDAAGKIVIAGVSNFDFLVARYESEFAPTATTTITDTPTETATITATFTPTETSTLTATFTLTPTSTLTATETPDPIETATVTDTPTSTLTATETPDPIETATVTDTSTSTLTATETPDVTETGTPILTATETPDLIETGTTTPEQPSATPSSTPELSNLIENGGFEAELTGWQSKKLTKDKVKCDKPGKPVAYEGECAFRFKGSVGEKSKVFQKPSLGGLTFNVGDVFTLEAYIKAKGQVDFQAQAKFTYADETKAKIVLKVSAATDGYVAFADDYALTDANLLKVKVALKNKSTKGKVDVDAVSLNYGTAAAESGLLALP